MTDNVVLMGAKSNAFEHPSERSERIEHIVNGISMNHL